MATRRAAGRVARAVTAAVTAVVIRRIAAGGEGVGRLEDGMTVFVPRAAPDDRLEIEVVERRRKYARARIRRVIESGRSRIDPRCPHYLEDGCGGCQLQHLDADAQLAAKRGIVGDALRRIGGRDLEDPEIVASPAPWRYRSRVTLAAAAGRIGYHRFDRPGSVLDLRDCWIAREPLMRLWARLADARLRFPDRMESVGIREDRDGGLHVVVATPDARAWDAPKLAEAVGEPAPTIWWVPAGGVSRVAGGPRSRYPVLAFEQVHPAFGDRIRADAVAGLGSIEGKTVWDLYGGTGDTAGALAGRGASVWSVDADRRAVEWGRTRQPDTGKVVWKVGLVEHVVDGLPEPGAVVVNPPRAGLAGAVAARIDAWAASHPGARVSYVSCDPATLARDLRRMPHMGIVSLTAYDLFPQTSHVETLAVLEAR